MLTGCERHPVSAPVIAHAAPPDAAPSGPQLPIPVLVPGRWKSVVGTTDAMCAIRDDATLWCWGKVAIFGNARPTEPREVPGFANVTAVGVGYTSICALVDKHARCVGWNYDGSTGVLPTDTHDFRDTPVLVPIQEPLAALSGGVGHACALAESGNVWCWGENDQGQLGEPSKHIDVMDPPDTRGPTQVAIPPARAIAAGRDVSCAIGRDDNVLRCWGDLDVHGSMGDPDRVASPPTAITTVHDVTAVVATEDHICVLERGAPPACWGLEVLVPGKPIHFVDRKAAQTPRVHGELAGATTLAIANEHICAGLPRLTRCLGWTTDVDAPVLSGDTPGTYAQLAVGYGEACGLSAEGELACWKFPNRSFELGLP